MVQCNKKFVGIIFMTFENFVFLQLTKQIKIELLIPKITGKKIMKIPREPINFLIFLKHMEINLGKWREMAKDFS
jgi:hypothetical protein